MAASAASIESGPGAGPTRIAALDAARGLALIAMASYHFAFDLEMFGWLAPGTAVTGPLRLYAISIASSFLALAGVSLVLAQGDGLRWAPFLRRLGVIAGAAMGVTLVSLVWAPSAPILFGILHAIALSSLVGLALLRLGPLMLLLVAILAFILPRLGRLAVPDRAWLDWTGLTASPAPSLDFVPILPWFAAFAAGMAVGRLFQRRQIWPRIGAWGAVGPRWLHWMGRNSLLVYLIHQPILVGLVWAATILLR